MSTTSLGYHTFTLVLRLTVREARELYQAFQKYSEVTIIPCRNYKLSPNVDHFTQSLYASLPRYYKIVYPKQEKGISFILRVCSSSPSFMDDDKPCSIKATINPKVFAGIKDYVTAADQSYLPDVIQNFNTEVNRISPILGSFDLYLLNRGDYCINFHLKELGIPCTKEQMMILIQRANIPRHFKLWTENNETQHRNTPGKNSFYLKNNSTGINCYDKHYQLSQKHSDCPNIDKALDVIRFEIQNGYLKIYNMAKTIKSNTGFSNPMVVQELLSDDIAEREIKKYFYKIIRKGDYYTLEGARKRIIEQHRFKKNRENRMIQALELVSRCRGISKAKDTLHGKELDDFKRSLRDLDEIGINPVTIPREWNIKHIPNLLTAYYRMIEDQHAKEYLEQQLLSFHVEV